MLFIVFASLPGDYQGVRVFQSISNTFVLFLVFFQFIEYARELCMNIRAKGYWADFIDPCSGLPMLTLNCNKVYSEVDGMECLLNYKAYNAGFCKILTHPRWGSAVYPATIFAYAPASIVSELVNQYPSMK
jgi:hypothetical protein